MSFTLEGVHLDADSASSQHLQKNVIGNCHCQHVCPKHLILTFYFLHKLFLETNNLHFRKAFRSLDSCLVLNNIRSNIS